MLVTKKDIEKAYGKPFKIGKWYHISITYEGISSTKEPRISVTEQ